MKIRAFDTFESEIKKAEISMTPLIDMVFILLIFFVVTTTFTKETGIKVEKAKATTSELIDNKLFTVAIDKNGSYWHDSKEYSLERVVAEIVTTIEKNNTINIVLIPDKNGRVEPLITLMDKLRVKEITKFSIGTERDGEE